MNVEEMNVSAVASVYTVSVVVPLYKGEKYIQYWKKIISQNCVFAKKNGLDLLCELLFVNDYPDEKIDEVRVVGCDCNFPIRVISSECNRGIHGARVLGCKYAKGEYILFIDQDDIISENYLFEQLTNIKDNDAVLCNAYIQKCFGKRVDRLYRSETDQHEAVNLRKLIEEGNTIFSPGQVLLRKASIPLFWIENVMKHNGTDDFLLWILMLVNKCNFGLVRDCIYTHVLNDSNASGNIYESCKSEMEFAGVLEMNNILPESDVNIMKNRFNNRIRCSRITVQAKIYETWLLKVGKGKKTEDFFLERNWSRIAIYGMNRLGSVLYMLLSGSNVSTVYGIDIAADSIDCEIPVFSPDSTDLKFKAGDVDVVVITPVIEIDKIKSKMQELGFKNVVTIQDVVKMI